MVSRNLRFRFTLVSYNILSQTLLNDHQYLYRACNPHDLEWPRRGHRIVNELLNNQADIICLQEVESEHLKSLYRPQLANYGYECLYKKKTGYKVDGCAIFYKSKLFHLLDHKGIEFKRTDVAHLLHRDNVGIIAILRPRIRTKSESSHLIIANTHLIFNPKRSDIKLAQLKFFLSELESFSMQSFLSSNQPANLPGTNASQRAKVAVRQQHPTILCGDLNSTPNSEVSRYILQTSTQSTTSPMRSMSKSAVDATATKDDKDDIEDEDLSQQSDKRKPLNDNQSSCDPICDLANELASQHLNDYKYPLKFKSVFPTHNRTGQKYVSTFSSEIVDYIFYTSKIRLESYNELLTETQLSELGPIPNANFPSDHIILGAKFVLK